MTFEEFKKEVIALARTQGITHLVPNANNLYHLWEKKVPPAQVIKILANIKNT